MNSRFGTIKVVPSPKPGGLNLAESSDSRHGMNRTTGGRKRRRWARASEGERSEGRCLRPRRPISCSPYIAAGIDVWLGASQSLRFAGPECTCHFEDLLGSKMSVQPRVGLRFLAGVVLPENVD